MKSCSFRGAENSSMHLFSKHEQDALYGLLRCKKPYCRFCFPTTTMDTRARYYPQPVLAFSPTHQHQFVNGYQTILNCPTVNSSLFCIREWDYIRVTFDFTERGRPVRSDIPWNAFHVSMTVQSFLF